MKKQRLNFKLLALGMFALFLALVLYGGYSMWTYGNRWFSSSHNPRVQSQKESVTAGTVYDRNGVVLAKTEEGSRVYQQDAADRKAVVHVLGDSENHVTNGVETFQTSYLYGFKQSLGELLSAALSGEGRKGDNITLTISSPLCLKMAEAMASGKKSAGKCGCAVVMNYKTGEIVGSVSLPAFDPMNIDDSVYSDTGHPFINRTFQSMIPPGSTFKIITTVSALRNIPNVQQKKIECGGGLDVGGQAIRDFGNAVHGEITLEKAFTASCNNVYALLALTIGDEKLRKTAEDFGFGDNFLFRDVVVENSSYPSGNRNNFEVATSGFGQSAITVTPMHMCMVAAACGNGGVMMEPRLLRQVVTPEGKERLGFTEKIYCTPMTAEEASTLSKFMKGVVTTGSGKKAQVEGMDIRGKTGTAESTLKGKPVNYGWFIGFSANESYPYAIAVVVEDIENGESGGTTAAPVAGDILAWIKDNSQSLK